MRSHARVRVAVLGIGSHVQRNLVPAFERSNKTELVALHTRSEATLSRVAEQTGATPYAEVEDLLASGNVDAVFIASPTGLHASMSRMAIDAGKHVWCEKPLTVSQQETEGLLTAAAEARVILLESDMFLHHPQFATLERLVKSREFGRILSMTGRFGFPHLAETNFRYSKQLGGGALLDAGFYPIAAAVAMLGPDLRLIGAVVERPDDETVDIGGTSLVAGDGAVAILDWGFGRSYRNEIEVWCENGVLTAERAFSKPADLDTQISIRPQTGDERLVTLKPADQFALMLDDFAAITTGEAPYDTTQIRSRARLLTEIQTLG